MKKAAVRSVCLDFCLFAWARGVAGQDSWSEGGNASLPQWTGGVSAALPLGQCRRLAPHIKHGCPRTSDHSWRICAFPGKPENKEQLNNLGK